MDCGKGTDFIYPLLADIYHPVVEQGAYGNVSKQWILDRSVPCNFAPSGSAGEEEIKPNANITQKTVLIGRTRADIRMSKEDEAHAVTNIVISNIRDAHCNPIYVESAGQRAGKSTIFEVATQEPVVGPFGSVEYYKLVIRRSENQAVDI
jgi:hypothetical protein